MKKKVFLLKRNIKNKKFFFIIISHKNSNKRERQKIELLQQQNPNIIFYYFIGDPNLKKEYAEDHENKIITLRVSDNYESLPMKTYFAINYVIKNYFEEIEGVFKTDDDTDLDLNLLYNNLCRYHNEDYFGNCINILNDVSSTWHFGKCEDNNKNLNNYIVPKSFYCVGGGYYINKKNLQIIQKNKQIFENGMYEDVCTGLSLNLEGIYPNTNLSIKSLGCKW